ncbi:MAG TPA: hypothetical protein VFS83_01190 [Ktedonobacterales bacterium]|nr:hypothetical protein [Ktedonobacterales bacterium]
MKRWSVPSIVAGVVVLAVAVVVAVNQGWVFADSSLGAVGLNAPPQATPIHHYGAESGSIITALTSPDNVKLQIVAVQRGTNEWLFHIHAHNNSGSNVTVLGANADHYFVLAGKGIPGTPYTFGQLTVRLTPPEQAVAVAHPALSSLVAGGADADGWLVADLSNFKYTPTQLLYVYGTVTAPACTNPHDQSTCHPSTGYRTIVWNL